jgi:hypothetical protein
VDVNRNDGTIRTDADIRARGDATTPPGLAPDSPQAAPRAETPPPVSEAPSAPDAADAPATPAAPEATETATEAAADAADTPAAPVP